MTLDAAVKNVKFKNIAWKQNDTKINLNLLVTDLYNVCLDFTVHVSRILSNCCTMRCRSVQCFHPHKICSVLRNWKICIWHACSQVHLDARHVLIVFICLVFWSVHVHGVTTSLPTQCTSGCVVAIQRKYETIDASSASTRRPHVRHTNTSSRCARLRCSAVRTFSTSSRSNTWTLQPARWKQATCNAMQVAVRELASVVLLKIEEKSFKAMNLLFWRIWLSTTRTTGRRRILCLFEQVLLRKTDVLVEGFQLMSEFCIRLLLKHFPVCARAWYFCLERTPLWVDGKTQSCSLRSHVCLTTRKWLTVQHTIFSHPVAAFCQEFSAWVWTVNIDFRLCSFMPSFQIVKMSLIFPSRSQKYLVSLLHAFLSESEDDVGANSRKIGNVAQGRMCWKSVKNGMTFSAKFIISSIFSAVHEEWSRRTKHH